MTRTITDPSELDVLHAEHHALSVAMHAQPPANPVRVCQCHPDDLRPADGDSPEAVHRRHPSRTTRLHPPRRHRLTEGAPP